MNSNVIKYCNDALYRINDKLYKLTEIKTAIHQVGDIITDGKFGHSITDVIDYIAIIDWYHDKFDDNPQAVSDYICISTLIHKSLSDYLEIKDASAYTIWQLRKEVLNKLLGA